MDPNPYSPPESIVKLPGEDTPTTLNLGVVCAVVLLLYMSVSLVFKMAMKLDLPNILLGLFVAVHICAWKLVHSVKRWLNIVEMRRLFFACSIVFSLFDNVLPLLDSKVLIDHLARTYPIAKVMGAIMVDVVTVAALVFLTVPIAERVYIRKMSPNHRIERANEP